VVVGSDSIAVHGLDPLDGLAHELARPLVQLLVLPDVEPAPGLVLHAHLGELWHMVDPALLGRMGQHELDQAHVGGDRGHTELGWVGGEVVQQLIQGGEVDPGDIPVFEEWQYGLL